MHTSTELFRSVGTQHEMQQLLLRKTLDPTLSSMPCSVKGSIHFYMHFYCMHFLVYRRSTEQCCATLLVCVHALLHTEGLVTADCKSYPRQQRVAHMYLHTTCLICRVPKERPNATRLLQHPFLAGVGLKAAPLHAALTLNTTIPPRVRQLLFVAIVLDVES